MHSHAAVHGFTLLVLKSRFDEVEREDAADADEAGNGAIQNPRSRSEKQPHKITSKLIMLSIAHTSKQI